MTDQSSRAATNWRERAEKLEGYLADLYIAAKPFLVDGVDGYAHLCAAEELLAEYDIERMRQGFGAALEMTRAAVSEIASTIPLEPTPAMIEAGAQRLVSWEDNSKWPDSWDRLQVAAARQEAERVWRSMWLEAKDSPCNSGAQALSGRGADEAEMTPIGLEGDRAAGTGSRTPAMSFEQWATTLNANASDLGSYARLAWDSAWRYAKQLYVQVADGEKR